MIIFGTRGVTSKAEEGAFFCPRCERREHYRQKRVRRFFTLFFIPVIPLDKLAEYVECGACGTAYELEVLKYDPEAEAATTRAAWEVAVTNVMIRMMMADGRVDSGEVDSIRRIFQRITDRPLSEADVLEQISAVEAKGGSIADDLGEFAPKLNEHGKEMVVRAALAVAAADGRIQSEEKAVLGEIASALRMSPAHLQGILLGAGEGSRLREDD